jgi:cytoskeletal protein CcmA (bactofilin family)
MADTDTTPTDQTPEESASLEPLESPAGALESSNADQPSGGPGTFSTGTIPETPAPVPPKKPNLLKRMRQRINIYLLLFIFIILLAGVIILIAYLQNRQASTTSHIQTQGLSQSTLQQLANGDATVGSSQSVLNVESSAVFAGQVLVRQNLQVAGNLQIGGTVALNNITVAGTSQLGQVNVTKNLAVAGDTAIQGSATIAKSLQVNGNGTFSGPVSAPQIVTGSLQLNGDLVLTHHISVGGSIPGRSGGSALGSGGSASVSGSDTAGSISINTGSGPAAGCFVTITFTSKYNSTPHVLVTPIGSAAGGLAYYVNRSTTSFSVCDASAPPAGSSFGFDYFVVD